MNLKEKSLGDYVTSKEIDIQTGPFGTQLRASDYRNTGIPVINVRNIGYGILKNDRIEYLPESAAKKFSKHLLKENDIVFGRKGAVDRHLLVTASQSGWIQGSDCIRIRITGKSLLPRYISYAFLLEEHKKWIITQCSNKATMASLNQDVISRIRINLPDIETQKNIIAILSSYDDLIENNRRRIALLEQSARLLYQEWFVRFRFPGHEKVKIVDGVPEGWEMRPIKEVVDGVFDGPHATPPAADDGPIFLGIKNISEAGRLDLTSKRFISETDFPKWTKRVTPQPGDIVFSYEATLNLYALIPEGFKGCLGRRLALVRPIADDCTGLFLYYSFFSPHWRSTIEKNRLCGATVDRVPIAKFPDFKLLMPPERLVKAFHEHVASLQKLMETLERQSTELAQARDLLLPRLMSGEIAV